MIDVFSRILQNADQNFLTAFKKYQNCFEKEAKTCDTAIMKHFLAYNKADEKLFKENSESSEKFLKEYQLHT